MSVRKAWYLVCCNCNNQYIDHDEGCYGETPGEIRSRAKEAGWTRRKMPSGVFWDLCPRCWERRIEKGWVAK